MNAPELAAVFLVALWLGVLTLTVLLVIRQLTLITARLDQSGRVGGEGPEIGSVLRSDVLPNLNSHVSYLLFVSPTCGPCLEIAPALKTRELGAPVLALFAGTDRMSEDFASLFPPWVEIVRDPDATTVAEALGVTSTPFAVEVESRVITGKAYMRDISDLVRLVEAREVSGAAEIAETMREVVGPAH